MEWRAATEVRVDGRRLEGLAVPFDRETRIADFTEIVRHGAFSRSLAAGSDIVALVDHDQAKLLGRTRTGTLSLTEGQRGLGFSLEVPDTQAGRDAVALAARGDLGGMSFGFTVPEGGERWNGRRRELVDVDLREVSVVSAWPAYEGTSVSARSRVLPRLAHARRFLETI
jgi:HK97 family phage prohead protease